MNTTDQLVRFCLLARSLFTGVVKVSSLVFLIAVGALTSASAQTNAAPSPTNVTSAQTNAAVAEAPTPPPGSAAKRSDADLEKLVAPIALYPDPLIATVLPASAYPLEIVQAARFVKDTNNIAKLDAQAWDENVKAVARLPDVIKQMDENLSWTSDLGDAFINQPKDVMDAIQTMRTKAEASGALKTTPQQVVTVTNEIVTNIVEQKTVYVTNQVVQIQPSQPQVIYVPQYNPTVVYGYPSTYVYPGYSSADVAAASVLSFGVGMAMGAVFANNCDWHGGGVYWGGHGDVDIDRDVNRNVNRNVNRENVQNRTANVNRTGAQQKWQPDQSRLKNSGSTLSSAQSREARGWSSGQAATGTASSRAQQARTTAGQARSSAGTTGTRPSASATGTRAGTTAGGTRPSTTQGGGRVSSAAGANRPSTTAGATRPSTTQGGGRISSAAGASRPTTTARPTPSTTGRSYGGGGGSSSRSSGSSAFSGVSSGSQARAASSRGSYSRSGGGSAGGYRGGGGGGGSRGGGGGGRRR